MNAERRRGDTKLSAQSWKTVSTSLVVTRTALDPQAISDALELPRAGNISEPGVGVVSQEGWWALVYSETTSPGPGRLQQDASVTYNLLTVDSLNPGAVTVALAECLDVTVDEVDVGAPDTDPDLRYWNAAVSCELQPVLGDLAWSLDVYVQE